MNNRLFFIVSTLFALLLSSMVKADVVMIGRSDLNMPKLNVATISRIYTGKIIEMGGIAIFPVNAYQESLIREKFLRKYLQQNEDKYSAYWTVRRFIGKGTPPKEIISTQEMIDYILQTPGAIGYIDTDKTNLPNNIKVLSQ